MTVTTLTTGRSRLTVTVPEEDKPHRVEVAVSLIWKGEEVTHKTFFNNIGKAGDWRAFLTSLGEDYIAGRFMAGSAHIPDFEKTATSLRRSVRQFHKEESLEREDAQWLMRIIREHQDAFNAALSAGHKRSDIEGDSANILCRVVNFTTAKIDVYTGPDTRISPAFNAFMRRAWTPLMEQVRAGQGFEQSLQADRPEPASPDTDLPEP